MYSSEIKIGDFVYLGEQIVKILTMDFGHCSVLDENNDVVPLIEYKDLSPIPISKEILKKNGFVFNSSNKNNLIYFPHNNEFQIYESEGEYFLRFLRYSEELFQIDYIHELQHIMWVLNIEDYNFTMFK